MKFAVLLLLLLGIAALWLGVADKHGLHGLLHGLGLVK